MDLSQSAGEADLDLICQSLKVTLGEVADKTNLAQAESKYVNQCEILSSLDQVLVAADKSQITTKRRVASCNALCNVVDQCVDSSIDDMPRLLSEHGVPYVMANIYIDRYDHAKAKAMKQVLNTFIRLLKFIDKSEHYPYTVTHFIQFFCKILTGDNHLRAKPAFHALTFMINKRIVAAVTLISNFLTWRDSGQSVERLGETPQDFFDGLQSLLLVLFRWIKHYDVAATAGQFLSTLLQSGQVKQANQQVESGFAAKSAVWIEPLIQSIQNDAGSLPAFRTYAFSALFKLDLAGYWAFLLRLNIENVLGGLQVANELSASAQINDVENEILFSALLAGKDSGIVHITPTATATQLDTEAQCVTISENVVEELITRASNTARIAALTLLLTSHQITAPLSDNTISILRRNLTRIFHDADTNFRGEVQSLLRSLVDRMRAVCFNIHNQIRRPDALLKIGAAAGEGRAEERNPKMEHFLHMHRSFIVWLLGAMISCLGPCASYQVHISALKVLSTIVRSGVDNTTPATKLAKKSQGDVQWPFHIEVFNMEAERNLLDLLWDPYDDIRQSALSLLQTQSASMSDLPGSKSSSLSIKIGVPRRHDLQVIRSRARDLMVQTGRVDHADGFARLCDLICFGKAQPGPVTIAAERSISSYDENAICSFIEELLKDTEDAIRLAEQNLYNAVGKAPVHGLFSSLRYCVAYLLSPKDLPNLCKQRAELARRMLDCVSRVWACVRHLLCNDAPEGHMPEDADDETDLSTKDIYSYSWRALKDSSLLLRELVVKDLDTLLQSNNSNEEIYRLWGDLCFEQLAELRHRGAFSTVSQTFHIICQACARHKNGGVQSLITMWYGRTTDLIRSKGSKITRRSAGIPALMIAVLAADPENSMLQKAVDDLQGLARAPTEPSRPEDLPQVHALNSLKAIFTTTRLASQTERYVTGSVKVAIECLRSQIWAIRNCGLMLFRGLFDRLLGSDLKMITSAKQEAPNSSLDWSAHPGLLDNLMGMLKLTETDHSRASISERRSVSGLEVESIFPAIDIFRRAKPPQRQLVETRTLIERTLSSPHWHVRLIASRTCAALIDQVNTPYAVPDHQSQNGMHGYLLTLRQTMRHHMLPGRHRELSLVEDHMSSVLDLMQRKNYVETVWGAFADILLDIAVFLLCRTNKLQTVSSTATDLQRQLNVTTSRFVSLASMFDSLTATPGFDQKSSTLERSKRLVNIIITSHLSFEESPDLTEGSDHIVARQLSRLLISEDVDVTLQVVAQLELFIIDHGIEYRNELLLALSYVIVDSVQLVAVRSAACGLLAMCLSSCASREHAVPANLLGPLSDLPLREFFWDSATPSQTENVLRLWAFTLDARFQYHGKWINELASETLEFIKVCSWGLRESNDYPLRYAAVSALNGLNAMLRSSGDLSEEISVKLFSTAYKSCVDDDDEVREAGAKVAMKLVVEKDKEPHRRRESASPPIACQMLCSELVKRHSQSTIALGEILQTFFEHPQSSLPPFATMLEEALLRDTALFATEKQNLYIDPANEAYTWSRALKQFRVDAMPVSTIHFFGEWTIAGLDTLIAKASSDEDGPLGWTSAPEVFALGMKLIYAAEVLLAWRRQTKKVHIRGSAVRERLARLREAGIRDQLHDTWLRVIEEVLNEAIRMHALRFSEVLTSPPLDPHTLGLAPGTHSQ